MRFKSSYLWLLLIIPLSFISWYLISGNSEKPLRKLPYFGPKNALKHADTSYHQVPVFSFTDQHGHTADENTIAGKYYVTEFFFTTCGSICPVMNKNLVKVYNAFRDDREFLILSYTVDPETDSVEVMNSYAASLGVSDRRWLFLTGGKKKLYEIARTGYLLDAGEGNGGEEDFIHTQNFALVDKDRHIRGYYDGTDSLEIERLISEIKLLQMEYANEENTAG